MVWIGEEIYPRILGIRGLKCIVELMRQELNVLRKIQGLPEYTSAEFLNHLDTLMTQHEADDQGPEPD